MSDKHGAHNHPTRDLKIQINKLRQLFLNEAETAEDKTLHEIHKDVSLAHPKIASKLPYKKMEPGMRNRRKRTIITYLVLKPMATMIITTTSLKALLIVT